MRAERREAHDVEMRVWIDQDLCIGNGICEEIAPDVIVLVGGLAYVTDGSPGAGVAGGRAGAVTITSHQLEAVLEAAETCPTECIYIEP